MNKKAKILFFCMIFVARGAFCQKPLENPMVSARFSNSKSFTQNDTKFNINSGFVKKKNSLVSRINTINRQAPLRTGFYFKLTADHYTKNFGFFCKKELQFEKLTKMPFKFRLGSIQYCDWMEGKKTAGILPNN